MSPPSDHVTSLSPPTSHSDQSITAQTASDTVMAEQSSHNVVESTLSTSASAPVDVAANQTSAASAEHGTTDRIIPQTKTDELQTSQDLNAQAVAVNTAGQSTSADVTEAGTAAEPSAGEATATATETSGSAPQAAVSETASTHSASLPNGVNGPAALEEGAAEDSHAPEGSVDISINSDTEGSRGDASEQKKDENHHNRNNSVKKPATFSKVSVTKTFLAKSSSTTPVNAKPADKPSPAGTPATLSSAKPRLIAKTGASLQPKGGLRTEAVGGPDASKVWNKNRPVAPPPPKQFTDEELKQQYGIHLATRLQTDENGKDKNWADIDDDEDDWAPDTVVWMDGTKSSLTPQETASSQKDLKASTPQPQKPAEDVRPKLALKRPTELGPTKTILKPGASTAAAQAKQNGQSSTPSNDKASAPSSVQPAKSPWAQLPPVDKVPLVNPPVQQQPLQPRLATQDARAYEPQPPQQPAREIAADTFDRSGFREGESGARELFNSASGKYEPAPEGRRASVKPDASYRKPAVLQRASQNGAPAEPSAAFQTRSENQMDGSWTRRRGSSVSHGSVLSTRRVSTSKGSDMSPAPERRTSTVIGHDMRSSPTLSRGEPAQPHAVFSQQSAWQQQMPARPEAGTEAAEDPVQKQERVMREKRELAKKRREEETAREEAEKQERLKARLAKLQGAGKSRKEREAEAAAAAAGASATPTTAKTSEVTAPSTEVKDNLAQAAKPAEMAALAAPALESQTLPSALGEPDTEQEDRLPSPLPSKLSVAQIPDKPITAADQNQNQRQQARPHLSPRVQARAPFQAQPSSSYGSAASAFSASPGDRKLQPFGRSPVPNSDSFATPWPTTAPNANVWGSSGIGNGTFESSSAFAPMQQTSALPPPPGMSARPSPSSRISPQALPQGSRSPSLQQQSLPEPHRGFAPPGFGDPYANQMRANGASPAPGQARQPHAPGPIAPPSRVAQQQAAPAQEDKVGAWRRAADSLPQQYRSDEREATARAQQRAAATARGEDTIKETFKRTSAIQGKLGAPRKYDDPEYTIHDAQGSRSAQSLSPAPPYTQTQPLTSASPLSQDPWKQPGDRTVRIPDASLAGPRGSPAQQPPIAPPPAAQRSNAQNIRPLSPPSNIDDNLPPPTESSLHPVSDGRLQVRLPPQKAVVKLPPGPPISQGGAGQQSVMMPQRPISNWGAPGSSKPIVMQQAWQERFNGLFNRVPVSTETPPSPPKTPPKSQGPALAVAASSRAVMDEAPVVATATVSLPQVKKATSPHGFSIDDSAEVTSKPALDQVFADELSFGSTPKVSIRRRPWYTHPHYATGSILNRGPLDRTLHVSPKSIFELDMLDLHHRRNQGIFINIPALKLRNKLVNRPSASRKPSGQTHERKTSGKFAAKVKGKENGTSLPAPSAGSGSKTEAVVDQTTNKIPEPSNETKKTSSKWAKPPKAPRRPHAQHRPVPAAQ